VPSITHNLTIQNVTEVDQYTDGHRQTKYLYRLNYRLIQIFNSISEKKGTHDRNELIKFLPKDFQSA
jgi:hypothetical protein